MSNKPIPCVIDYAEFSFRHKNGADIYLVFVPLGLTEADIDPDHPHGHKIALKISTKASGANGLIGAMFGTDATSVLKNGADAIIGKAMNVWIDHHVSGQSIGYASWAAAIPAEGGTE